MTALIRRLSPLAAALLMAGCVGTESSTPTPITPSGSSTTPEGAPADPADAAPSASNETLTADELADVKKLPEADATLALEQKICPSSGGLLGAMGVPIKMEALGQTVFVCCAGCKEDVEKHPEAMLAKLGKKAGAEAPTATP